MGTRCDFYVGQGKEAEWIGSYPFNGYPEGVEDEIKLAKTEVAFREAVKAKCDTGNGTIPEQGWPWPWEDSHTTDFAYCFVDGKTLAFSWGAGPIDIADEQGDEKDYPKVDWPNMKDRQRVTIGHRSGLIVLAGALLAALFLGSFAQAQEKSCVSVVTIHGAGSGTVVAKDGDTRYVLTNKHVVSATDKKVWIIYDRKRYEAKFVKAHPDVDLALVSVQIDAEPVVLAEAEPKEGDEVKHFGRATEFQTGKVTGWTNFQSSDGVVMDSDIFSIAGDSGAGLFNSKGQLVSVHYGRRGDPLGETTAISVRLTNIRSFLKEYTK